jgi:hypothetical protein
MTEIYSGSELPSLAPVKKGWPWWAWLFIGLGVVSFFGCGGCVAVLIYLGVTSPETSVYAGNQVPSRYIEVMKEVGALEPDETLLFFYSDGLTNIREGFYFVSDRKVVIYSSGHAEPLTAVPFREILDAELDRDTSFFADSQITLSLRDETSLWFPVSSDYDRDIKFFEAIQKRAGR